MSHYYTMLDKNKSFVDKMVELIKLYQEKTKLPLRELYMIIGQENIENCSENESRDFEALIGCGLHVRTDPTLDKDYFIIKSKQHSEMEMEFMIKKNYHYKEEDHYEF